MIIERIYLAELLERIQTIDMESVIGHWLQIKGAKAPAPCQTCIFELMKGRRCCCLCLETSLTHTSLRLHLEGHLDGTLRTTIASIKAHRSEVCAQCASQNA